MKIKLLVVDDSAFMRKIIQDVLEDIKEIEVVGIARNGLEALEKIKKLNPDIVTLDIEMPKLNGIDTLKIIKSDYNIPVIMLSSQSGIDNTILALELGAEDFIEKPKNLNENLDLFTNE
ncbi:MAG TPA: response regulator, partial [Tissierellaceae bacterium]